jgi:hypothetical protein
MKKCQKCKRYKDEKLFSKDKYSKDGLQRQCKLCDKKYRELNYDILKQKRISRNHIRAKKLRVKRKKNTAFNFKENIQRAFRYYFHEKNIDKIFKYTGISIKEYFNHLEKDQYWKDYKKNKAQYHIDHIIPCSLYDLFGSNEIIKCSHPCNLRILPAIYNIRKHNNIDMKLVNKYKIQHLLPKGIKIVDKDKIFRNCM